MPLPDRNLLRTFTFGFLETSYKSSETLNKSELRPKKALLLHSKLRLSFFKVAETRMV